MPGLRHISAALVGQVHRPPQAHRRRNWTLPYLCSTTPIFHQALLIRYIRPHCISLGRHSTWPSADAIPGVRNAPVRSLSVTHRHNQSIKTPPQPASPYQFNGTKDKLFPGEHDFNWVQRAIDVAVHIFGAVVITHAVEARRCSTRHTSHIPFIEMSPLFKEFPDTGHNVPSTLFDVLYFLIGVHAGSPAFASRIAPLGSGPAGCWWVRRSDLLCAVCHGHSRWVPRSRWRWCTRPHFVELDVTKQILDRKHILTTDKQMEIYGFCVNELRSIVRIDKRM